MAKASEDGEEASIEHLEQLRCRNQSRDDEACVVVPLEDALKGPGHVARKLIEDIKNDSTNDFQFNNEQIVIIGCSMWSVEQAWRTRVTNLQRTGCATVDTLCKLPNDLGLPRIGIIGGGGCGKTTIMQLVVGPTLRTFFNRSCPRRRPIEPLGFRPQRENTAFGCWNATPGFHAHIQSAHQKRPDVKAA